MLTDMLTVFWKEWREIIGQQGAAGGNVRRVIILLIMGIMVPVQNGPEWVTSPGPIILGTWLALFMASSLVADTFAGERERHTLESLLATPLSDQAVLLGKAAAVAAYGQAMGLAVYLMGLLALNVTSSQHGLLLPEAPIWVGAVVFSFLGSWLAAGAGILVSMKAATMRAAGQSLYIANLVIIFAPVLAFQAMPDAWKHDLQRRLSGLDLWQAGAVLTLGLLGLDLLLLYLASLRFRRARLLLEG